MGAAGASKVEAEYHVRCRVAAIEKLYEANSRECRVNVNRKGGI